MYKKGEYFGFSAAFVEVVILNYLENCTHFKWIARDQDGCLCIYEDKPHREKLMITLATFIGIEVALSQI